MTVNVVEQLRSELPSAVSADPAELDSARSDHSGHRSSGPALAVVTARSVSDVQTTMRIASANATPVVTRGAGTGLSGGAIAGTGEIVLSTLAMNRVVELSVSDELAVVEPGILNGAFNDSLAKHRLWFAPDPASRAISTIGGNIATNAGGLLCAKYGVTREAILGLKVVLADGRLLKLGHRSVKGVTGLDLTALMIGSEGTLGVIVEATVRLRPLPRGTKVTIGATFTDVVAASAASAAITAAGLAPAVMELMDSASVKAVNKYLGMAEPARNGSYLLVQTDGTESEADALEIESIIRRSGGEPKLSSDAQEDEQLLAMRRALHPALAVLGNVLIEDVAVPRSRLPEMFAVIAKLEAKFAISIPTVAHAGDGNLHPNFIVETPEVPAVIWEAAGELFASALELGGTLTGEHGVGILKKRWLGTELGDDQLELQRQIKRVFDPQGILNPGKVF